MAIRVGRKQNASRCLRLIALGIAVFSSLSISVQAEESEADFGKRVVQRKQAFEIYEKSLSRTSESEQVEAMRLVRARKERELKLEEQRERFAAQMKRYSMEETEARDRKDEERLAREDGKADQVRTIYVGRRDRLNGIEAERGFIDPYREQRIDFSKEPESKASATEKAKRDDIRE